MLIRSCQRRLVYALYLGMFLQLFVPRDEVAAKKTGTRSGLVATGTQVARGGSTSQDDSNSESYSSESSAGIDGGNLTALDRLSRDIFVGYVRSSPPVQDHRDRVNVEVDLTYRQVLDLDEKNQILKSLIWYRQYWRDMHLQWSPADYDGITQISIPASDVWRPDVTVYEEVGNRDLNPRLPFVRVSSNGDILYAEPTILETSCGVNTAFFPFDSQKCTLTFVSWTQSVKYIDLRAQREESILEKESLDYFVDTGEWVLKKFSLKKRIATYDTIQVVEIDSYEDEASTDMPNVTNYLDTLNNVTSGTVPEAQVPEAQDDEVLIQNNHAGDRSYIVIPATHRTTEEEIGRKLTDKMYAEVMFSIILQRNSSLYMQSMLFPSILLTTVALFGFYLPPDSGERVGLQITILLTFMVFLLTVGEMFPASTGPYIGIYFVLSMAQLGVNIAMTIFVLHLHFKPCIRDKSTWKSERPQWYAVAGQIYEGESMIPVRYRRVLQFFAKYFNIADDGAVWMWPISNQETSESHKTSKRPSTAIEGPECDSILEENEEATESTSSTNGQLSPSVDSLAESNGKEDENELPSPEKQLDPKVAVFASKFAKRRKSPAPPDTGEEVPSTTDKPRKRSKAKEIQKLLHGFKSQMKEIKKRKDKELDEEFEESVEKEQEEWKSVARAVDKLCFRLYLFIMVVSYVSLAGVAIRTEVMTDLEI